MIDDPPALVYLYILHDMTKQYPNHTHSFQDVLSTEDWAMEMVRQPVLAVLFLFPVKDVSEAHRHEEAARIQKEGQVVSDNLFYVKQDIGNACGTIGLLHALGNNREMLHFGACVFL